MSDNVIIFLLYKRAVENDTCKLVEFQFSFRFNITEVLTSKSVRRKLIKIAQLILKLRCVLLQVIHDAEARLEIIKITVEVEREKLQQARFTLREQEAKHMGRSTSSGTAHTLINAMKSNRESCTQKGL